MRRAACAGTAAHHGGTQLMKVYIADTESLMDPLRFANAYEAVGEERQRKVDRFRFPRDKRLSLGAGLLLKEALLNENAADMELAVSDRGKPYLKNCPELYFSLSHSGTKAMCAIDRRPVGCDIEIIDTPPLKIAGRFFSAEEQSLLNSIADKEQLSRYFYMLWTGKESYLKLTGEGLSGGPEGFTVRLPFGAQEISGNAVTFYELPCGSGYQAALCVSGVTGADDKLELITVVL